MRFDNFELSVPEARELMGYSVVNNNQVYTVFIANYSPDRCNVEISIDGKPIGTFRLNAGQNARIEHSTKSDARFTFVETAGVRGRMGGLNQVPKELRGLIEARFIPEFKGNMGGATNFREGGTIGTGHSDQKFGTAEAMAVDENKAVTIFVRLVISDPPATYAPPPAKPRFAPCPPPL